MRRFIEEIQVGNPMIADKIITALETRSENKNDPVFEVDMYGGFEYDPCAKPGDRSRGCVLKIFVREEPAKTDSSIGFC